MIVGIKEEGNVVLAFSSFDGFSRVNVGDMTNGENVGLWKIKTNPHTVMGCVFPTAESDAYRYEEEMFQGKIDYDKLAEEILPAMEQFAEEKEYIGNDNGKFEQFLIAQRDRLFRIESEHIIMEIDSSVVLAELGEDFAKGVLYATQGEPTLDRIRKIFEFAAYERQCDPYPISVMDTRTGKLHTLTREDNQ